MSNSIRLFSLGCAIALSATVSGGQITPGATADALEKAGTSTLDPNANLFQATPPKPAKVTCTDDRLAISAQNSTLGSILVAVRNCLGVQIDIPDGSGESRAYDQLGPGPVREVLESLLDATDFNYVIGSSMSNPEKVETVILMLRDKDTKLTASTTDLSQSPKRLAWLQARQAAGVAGEREEQNRQAMAEASGASPSEEVSQPRVDTPEPSAIQGAPPPQAPSPAYVAAPPVDAAPAAVPDTAASPEVKETENKINAMQQMFEQRAKMIQNQNSTPKQ